MLTVFKPLAEKSLQPLAHLLRNANPNSITMLGLLFPVVFFVLVQQGAYGWALLAFACNAVDMLDGLVARAQGKVTAFGGFLDSTVDRFADFAVIVAFSFSGIVPWEVVAPLLLCTYLISYIRSRTELAAKGNLVASVGIMERTERLALLFVGLAAYAIWPHTAVGGANIMTLMCLFITALSVVTIGQRIHFAYRNLK